MRFATEHDAIEVEVGRDFVAGNGVGSARQQRLPERLSGECRRVHRRSSLTVRSGIAGMLIGGSDKPERVAVVQAGLSSALVIAGSHRVQIGIGRRNI